MCVGSGGPPHAPVGAGPRGSPSPQHMPGPSLRLHPPEATGRARWSASATPHPNGSAKPERPTPPPPRPQRGPNSIAHGLMNSRALIGSPGDLWIYASCLSSRGCRAPPGVVSEGVGLGTGQRLRQLGFYLCRCVGASPEPQLGTARPVPRSRCPGAYLPAPGSPEPPRRPRRPKRAPNPGAPARRPSHHPRSEMPAGEGRPGPCACFPFLSEFL